MLQTISDPKDEVLFCIAEIGKQNVEYALLTKYQKEVFQLDSLREQKVDTIPYDGALIQKITTADEVFFTTVVDSILVVSSSQLLTENSIRQKNVKDRGIDETFYKLYNTSDTKKSATVFINNNKITALSGAFFEETISGQAMDLADWTMIELTVSPDELMATGIATASPSASKTITIFDNTIPQKNQTALFTPLNATGFISFTFDDYSQLRTRILEYTNRKHPGLDTIKNDTIFKGINEIGVIFGRESKHVILHATAIDAVKTALVNGAEPVSRFRGISIYQCSDTQLITKNFSPLVATVSVVFYAFVDNFVVFAPTRTAIQRSITNYLNSATLAYSASYKDFIARLNDKASVLMVGLTPGFKSALQGAMVETYRKDADTISLKKYPYFAFQLINDRNFSHLTTIIKKTAVKNTNNAITQLFSFILDADIAFAPQFVTNHRTKQKEIVVQDTNNTLYLISTTGKLLWKKKLDSSIQGEIQQVDLYRNGRLQLAFVTRNTLHIIDRNGNEVTPFPMRFSNAITQPLAVFDYDNDRNYRFLVCQGRTLNMYNSEGKIVSGFTRTQTQSNILFPPEHFRIGTKDYLVISEEDGTLHILHRTGKTRIRVDQKISFSENPVYRYNNKFTVTDKKGILIQVDQDGKITSRNLNLEQDHYINTTNKTLVTLSGNTLTIKGKKVILDFGFYTKPHIFYVNNKIYVAVTDMQSKKVYVYDSNAVLLPNFPVYGVGGIAMDDVDNDKKPEFTVQGDANTILFYEMY